MSCAVEGGAAPRAGSGLKWKVGFNTEGTGRQRLDNWTSLEGMANIETPAALGAGEENRDNRRGAWLSPNP